MIAAARGRRWRVHRGVGVGGELRSSISNRQYRCTQRAELCVNRPSRYLFVGLPGIRTAKNGHSLKKAVILVVEDEALIRINLVHVAEDEGYEVLEAANAGEAIKILESRSDICTVLTDVRMPGRMDGLRLAHFIKGRWPPVQLILMSGLDILDDSHLDIQSHFIRKPYANGQITAVLRDARSGQYRSRAGNSFR